MRELHGIGPVDGLDGLDGFGDGFEDLGDRRLGDRTEFLECLSRFKSQPAIFMREQRDQHRERFRSSEETERFASPLTLMYIAGIRHLNQLGDQGIHCGAFRQFLCGPTANNGRPIPKSGHEFPRAFCRAFCIEAARLDGGRHCLPAEPLSRFRLAARQKNLLQGERVGEYIACGRTESVVITVAIVGVIVGLTGTILFAPIVSE